MPCMAQVAFRVVFGFGLLALSFPAWCSDIKVGGTSTRNQTIDTTPKTTIIKNAKSATTKSTLTLDDVMARTLEQNPKLAFYSQEIKAREFEARQAGLWPNPELSVEIGNIGGSGNFSGTDNAETVISISQLIELGGKRKQREALGHLDRTVAERDYEIAGAAVLAQAKERFVATLAAQQRVVIATEQVALTTKVLRSVEDRIAAGKTAEIERLRFQTLTGEARLRKDRAQRELAAARQALAALWGSETVDFTSVSGQLDATETIPDWPELLAKLDGSPEVAKQQEIVRRADQAWQLEQANRIPDLTFSLGAKNDRESGDNALLAEISIPLQLFDRNQNGIAATRARNVQTAKAARSEQLTLQTELAAGWQKLHSAHDEVIVLRDELLPTAERVFAATSYGYRSGKFGFIELLDAERTLFETKDRYVAALTDYHRALAQLERLLGGSIFQTSVTSKTISTLSEDKRGQS